MPPQRVSCLLFALNDPAEDSPALTPDDDEKALGCSRVSADNEEHSIDELRLFPGEPAAEHAPPADDAVIIAEDDSATSSALLLKNRPFLCPWRAVKKKYNS